MLNKMNLLTEKINISLNEKNKKSESETIPMSNSFKQSNLNKTNKYKFSYSNVKSNETPNKNELINKNTKDNKSEIIVSNNFNSNDILNSNIHFNSKKTILQNKNIDYSDNSLDKKIINISISNNNVSNKKIFSSENLYQSPSKLKNNCKTYSSINNISNIKYINGTDKNISEKYCIRNPDIQFITQENGKKLIQSKCTKKNIGQELEEKTIYDSNSNYIRDRRKIINRKLYEERKLRDLKNGKSNILNIKRKIINHDYCNNENNITNINNNIIKKNSKKMIKKHNIETYPIIFSYDENSEIKSKFIKNNIKYYSPEGNRKNRKYINMIQYNSNYYSTVNELVKNSLEKNNLNTRNNRSHINICSCSRNSKNLIKKNHNFKSINESKSKNLNSSNYSIQRNDLNKSNESNQKYKYDIKIHNIGFNKGMNHSVSYRNYKNNENRIFNLYSTENSHIRYNSEEKNKSYDNKNLKLQNAQNMQIIQDEKIFQILVPIPSNKIEYSCDFQISSSYKKNYVLEGEKEERRKRRNIHKKEIIEENIKENRESNKKENNNYLERKYFKKKPNWNTTNETIKENNISYDFNKKIDDINNIQKNEIIVKKIDQKKELDIENFEINIFQNRRQFKGDMVLENNSIEYEKEQKNPNKNLLLSQNEAILLKADYQKRDWNSITKPIREKPLSIEKKPKILLERREKELYINGKKNKQNLSKERFESINIKGNEKNWNIITKKENKSDFTIKGIVKEKIENNAKDEDILINDDYNNVKKTSFAQVRAKISKEKENSEESSSEYDVFKYLKRNSGNLNDYKDLINESMKKVYERKVIIKNITRNYPNGIETIGECKKIKSNNISNIIQKTNNDFIYNQFEIINKKLSHNSNNYIISSNSNGNENEQYPKYIYRENIQIKINGELDKLNKYKNNDIQNNNNNIDNHKSEINTPKRETKLSYREEILTLSPKSSNKKEGICHELSNQSIINNKYFENQDEMQSISHRSLDNTGINSIYIQNENQEKNIQIENNIEQNIENNVEEQNYFEKSEQEIPKISDETPQSSNYYIFNQEKKIENSQKIKYICIKGNTNKNINNSIKDKEDIKKILNDKNNTNIMEEKNVDNNKSFLKSGNNSQVLYQQHINKNEEINNRLNFDSQNKMNSLKTNYLEKNDKNHFELENKGLNNEKENTNGFDQIDNININKSEIINTKYLNNINYLNNLNTKNNQLDQIEISKSQVISSSSTEKNIKDDNLIQYSNHLMTNPNDNYNIFSKNKFNLMSLSSRKNGNIIFNNTLSLSKKINKNNKKNQENFQSNEMNDKNLIVDSINSYSFGLDSQLNNNSKCKVKVIKH